MQLFLKRLTAAALAAAVGVGVVGCGSDKKVEPKADPNAPKLEEKTPNGGPKPAGPKGKAI